MYDSFYNFTARPFQLTPDPRFWFESATHRTAMSYLGYGLAQGEGFIVITGEVGSGKTTLVGHVMKSIDPARLTAARLVSTQVADADLLRLVCDAFGIAIASPAKSDALAAIETFLHEEARAGRRTLLIVDEAQNLAVSALEELRMLSNFQLGETSLLQIFLLAQPEFRATLASPQLEQLRQRVIATHHLEAMLPEEVEPYLIHRLTLVGWKEDPVFAPSVYDELWRATSGIPRRINTLVSRLLLHGAVDERHELDGDDVRTVVADMGLSVEELVAGPTPVPTPAQAPAHAPAPETFAPDFTAHQPMATEPAPAEPMAAVIAPAEFVQASSAMGVPAPAPAPSAVFSAPAAMVHGAGNVASFAAPAGLAPIFQDSAPLAMAAQPAAEPAPEPEIVAEPVVARAAPELAADTKRQRIAALEQETEGLRLQIGALEQRCDEQDAAIRRILGLLIQWVEDGEDAARPAHGRAA
ncbi:MAG: XrtA/PEP-CTERM system-associated ATPase [Sphingopyxis sp.]